MELVIVLLLVALWFWAWGFVRRLESSFDGFIAKLLIILALVALIFV
ncbi:hypothetical protein [Magnetospirillum sp. ME-1]|nr:hypothetical protein [Magnetospirillum sp. ME-1]